MYEIWQCEGWNENNTPPHDYSQTHDPFDFYKWVLGLQGYPGPGGASWWDEPAVGYYCPTYRDDVLRQHAEMLRDAGIDFAIIDFTNWPNHSQVDTSWGIEQPFAHMLSVWATVPGAPKIVPLGPIPPGGDELQYLAHMMDQYPNLGFTYKGKPLIGVASNVVVDATTSNQLAQAHTVRRMWGALTGAGFPDTDWSFIETKDCEAIAAASGTAPCNQRMTYNNGALEELPVGSAWINVSRHRGNTFVHQFATAFQHPEAEIALVNAWNQWLTQSGCRNAQGQAGMINCVSDFWPDGSKVYLDNFHDLYHITDIEPSKNAPYDFYYQLMKDCISKFRQGSMCNATDVPYPGDRVYGSGTAKMTAGTTRWWWSTSGPIANMTCVNVNEPKFPSWSNNYLCTVPDVGLKWTFNVNNDPAIAGMRCTTINDPAYPVTADNDLCLPQESAWQLTWSYNGPIVGKACVRMDVPGDPVWQNKYLCVDSAF